jgi:very-short-patch-repair endonuclease
VWDEAYRASLEDLLRHHIAVALGRSPEPATRPHPAELVEQRRWQERAAVAARQRGTLSESALWHELERGSPFGWQREVPWGDYRLDFYCPAARLAVEVDGSSHRARQVTDSVRDAWFATQGVETLRVAAADVERDAAAVVARVNRRCLSRGATVSQRTVSRPSLLRRLSARLSGLPVADGRGPAPPAAAYTGRRLGSRFVCGGCRRELPATRRAMAVPGRCTSCADPQR